MKTKGGQTEIGKDKKEESVLATESNIAKDELDYLPQKVSELDEKAKKLEEQYSELKNYFEKLEKRIKSTSNFVIIITSGVGVVFTVAFAGIILDYSVFSEQRYEKFVDKIETIKKDFYTQEQVDKNISQIENNFNEFKNCLKNGGWTACF